MWRSSFILLLLGLLIQVVQGSTWPLTTDCSVNNAAHACCADVMESDALCACASSAEDSRPQQQIPPPTGRERLPQPLWTASATNDWEPAGASAAVTTPPIGALPPNPPVRSQVRLPVLFRALLT